MTLFLRSFAPFQKHQQEHKRWFAYINSHFYEWIVWHWIHHVFSCVNQSVLKHFMNGCRYLSGGKMKWSWFWVASVHISLYVRPPLCSLMSRPPSNEDNTSLWLMQHSFLLESPPTWLAISVSVLPWLEESRRLEGTQTTHSKQPILMFIPAEAEIQ